VNKYATSVTHHWTLHRKWFTRFVAVISCHQDYAKQVDRFIRNLARHSESVLAQIGSHLFKTEASVSRFSFCLIRRRIKSLKPPSWPEDIWVTLIPFCRARLIMPGFNVKDIRTTLKTSLWYTLEIYEKTINDIRTNINYIGILYAQLGYW